MIIMAQTLINFRIDDGTKKQMEQMNRKNKKKRKV